MALALGFAMPELGTAQETTTRVTVDSWGAEGNDNSETWSGQSISADGRCVVFLSYATNLVPSDTNHAQDVFVHDRMTGETSRVSVDSTGVQGNSYSGLYPSISANGRYVAFESHATNLSLGTRTTHGTSSCTTG